MIPFTKMQGLGNDYVYVDNRAGIVLEPGPLAIQVSDRHFGIGSDGLVLIEKSDVATARMRMFNADGTESEMCGNAIRCVARFVWDRWNVKTNPMTIETKAGIKPIRVSEVDGEFSGAAVDMGEPILEPAVIPVQSPTHKPKIQGLDFVCVSMGNPHAVTFVQDTASAPVLTQGHALETDPIFPRRSNIEFCQVLSSDRVRMRVWERGAGETLACGTGACATAVACALTGQTGRSVTVELLGGPLQIDWQESDNHVIMTGPAEFVFDGVWSRGV